MDDNSRWLLEPHTNIEFGKSIVSVTGPGVVNPLEVGIDLGSAFGSAFAAAQRQKTV